MENRHIVYIQGSLGVTQREAQVWGEASWWPKNSLMKFERKDSGPLKVGTRYCQKVLLPCAPSWDVEITVLDNARVTRKFLNGMFEGSETVSCTPEPRGVKVAYVMQARVKGVLNKILWFLMFKRLHNKNIEAILAHLKRYMESV